MPRVQLLFVFSTLIAAAQSPSTITGSAFFRERIAIPPNSTFEATLEDVSRADAPAKILGTARIENAGNPPYKFSIAYDPAKIAQSRSYVVRARILSNNQLMFISDGFPVLTRGKGADAGEILMRRAPASPLGALPATFAGTLPCADCPGIRYDLNLNSDQSYTLRNTYLERSVAPLESKGRWQIRQNTLALSPTSGKGQSFAIKSADTLRMLDQSGKEIASNLNFDLKRVAAPTASLKETYWKLTYLGSDPVTIVANQKEPNIILHTAENRVTGSGGCNSISGTYELNGDNLKFGQTISTMMACVNGMATEQAMLKALSQTRRYKITGQNLDLLDEAGNRLARFEAVALR